MTLSRTEMYPGKLVVAGQLDWSWRGNQQKKATNISAIWAFDVHWSNLVDFIFYCLFFVFIFFSMISTSSSSYNDGDWSTIAPPSPTSNPFSS